jgi:hypothetical protein
MTEAAYGKRFLSALRQEFRSTPSLPYATLVAIESADRNGMVAILSGVKPRAPGDDGKGAAISLPPVRESMAHLAQTAEPKELAQAFAAELRRLHSERVSRDALTFYGLGFVYDLLGGFLGD